MIGEYTAIIIEPRKHDAMELVLKNFTSLLDERWNFIIFHGNNNKEFIEEIINNSLSEHLNRIKLIDLHVDNLNAEDYKKVLFQKEFYDDIPTEYFLIFQTDTIISSRYKDNIYKFIEKDYDYVGAPWRGSNNVGNGGLSLRKKSKMLEILEKCDDLKFNHEYNELHGEDILFSLKSTERVSLNKPDGEEAKEFSVETIYSENAFGLHNAWGHNSDEDTKKLAEYFEDLPELILKNKK